MFGLIRRVFGRRERETDMRREFEAHLQTEIDERIASGMSPAEARRTALRDFGSMARIREDARTAWIPRGLDRLRQDLDYGARMLRRNPALTLVAALSLALGIGANTVVFSIVESVLLQPFPFRDTDRLVFLWQGPDGASLENQVPGTVLERWQNDSTLIEGLTPYTQTATESAGAGPVRVSRVGHEIFDVLGVRPLIGPGFRPEGQERGPAEVVLSHGFWQLRFGGNPGVIGRTVELNNGPREIVGVMPPGFFFPEPDVDIWWNIPSMDLAAVSGLAQYLPGFTGEAMTNAQVGSYFGVARLAPDISLELAQAELDVVVARLEEFPDDEPRVARLFPVRETVIGNYRLVLWTLLGAVSLLLLLASSNVASLLLARGMTRQKELAIRGALGAGPRRLLGQLLAESLLLALVAGVVAAGLAWQGIRLILGMGLVDIPRIETASMNWSVVLFAALVSLVAGVVSGHVPAWRASRTELVGSLNLGHVQALSQAGSGRLRDLLVVSQVAIALILLVGTGLLVNSSVALARIDWGFESENLTAMTVDSRRFDMFGVNPTDALALAESATQRLRRIPGIESASFAASVPLVDGNVYKTERVAREGAAVTDAVTADSYFVGPGYFRTLGVPVRGRNFSESTPARDRVILGASLAERLFPDADPIGRTIHLAAPTGERDVTYGPGWDPDAILVDGPADPAAYAISDATRRTVIGVAGDFRMRGSPMGDNSAPAVYIDYRDVPSSLPRSLTVMRPNKFLIRSSQPAPPAIETIRAALLDLDASFEFRSSAPMEDLVSRSIGGTGSSRLLLSLWAVFGALALVLAAVGIYGSMSHVVARRIPEFGVRIALGARPTDMLRLVLMQAVALTVPGLVLGLAGAWATTRVLANVLFGVTPTDPATFTGVTLFLLAVAIASSLIPAFRASAADPLTATRAEQ